MYPNCPRPAVPDWPQCRNSDAGLRAVNYRKTYDASRLDFLSAFRHSGSHGAFHVHATCPGSCCVTKSLHYVKVYDAGHVHVDVHAVCPHRCCMFMSMSIQPACLCPCCMSSMLHTQDLVYAAFPCQCRLPVSNLYAHSHGACPYPCCISMSILHVHVCGVCPCQWYTSLSMCISLSMLHVHVHLLHFISTVHVHVHGTCPCPWCISMSMLHVHVFVYVACPCRCCMSMFILLVYFHSGTGPVTN
jgi:hypothetical protein